MTEMNVYDTLQGLSKFGLLGEVSINFADYALATKLSSLSLPIKNTRFEAVLHVSYHCFLYCISLHHNSLPFIRL